MLYIRLKKVPDIMVEEIPLLELCYKFRPCGTKVVGNLRAIRDYIASTL
ncbi:hypothetical protein FOXB_04397 [Fusarium oxysporum f. sp. conglutinans Fo5176]|uniref:Uncharacterized protein n=1 Tax=Fusarium oxysporum (strain Fo5176) TaxID=660025 RepID=F9FDB9_FUSOF|nr:hypothetical protein FOXB_04397 [Fusarium oxysporum f. sp. conglutinans Fo5176]